jgi:hypothetical protein
MERIEDRSKALSYIGIEVADALKVIPTPAKEKEEVAVIEEEPVVAKTTRTRAAKSTKATRTVAVAAVATEKPKAKTKVVTPILPVQEIEEEVEEELQAYTAATTFERKPSLWQKIKGSKLGRAVSYVFKIRIRIELPNALPEGRGEF